MTPAQPAGERWSAIALTVLIAFGTILFIGETIWQLIARGPFGYHLGRDPTWQGGLEVLALCALLALVAAVVRSSRLRTVLLLLLGELYLRRHYVDLPILVDVFYFEILIGLGAGAARLCGFGPAGDIRSYLKLALAGIVLWSLAAWTLSAFGFGSLKFLRMLTLVLAMPAFAARHTPFALFLWRRFSTLDRTERAGVAALGAWFLCLAARTNVVSGFDAWWYGLRGEFVLVAGGSVFKSLGLVAPVHYYPKLYELLLIPVSAMHDTSLIEGISIGMLALFALTCMELLREWSLGFRTRLLLTALCVTVPAIANSALSPKPDVFMAWVLLFACLEAVPLAREGSRTAARWMLVAFALAFASKLSAPPFIVALLVGTLVMWLRSGRPRRHETGPEHRFAGTIALCALAVAALVTARTWLLAGVPLVGPEQLIDLFAWLGMPLKPPVGLLLSGPPVDWHGLPALLADQLFRPQRLAHMVITWIGNVWLYLFVLALFARAFAAPPAAGPPADDRPRVPIAWSVVLLASLALLVTFRTITRGGDGNYFVLPIALAILVSGYLVLERLPRGMPTRVLLATLPLFVVFQAAYSFVSAGWATGTRAFDFDFTHTVHDLYKQSDRIFEGAGIANIAHYMNAVPGIPRGVGFVADGPAPRLKGTFETLNFYTYWNRPPLESASAFIDYLADHRLDYLILPKPGARSKTPAVEPTVAEAAQRLRTLPGVHLVEDRDYVLYDLSAMHAAVRSGS